MQWIFRAENFILSVALIAIYAAYTLPRDAGNLRLTTINGEVSEVFDYREDNGCVGYTLGGYLNISVYCQWERASYEGAVVDSIEVGDRVTAKAKYVSENTYSLMPKESYIKSE